ncbi:MAG: VWA domain-containing protein [Cruoricaptor ignavus]|nr:VWA domain-containing protein [Cruoricaptor ignavus]
MNWTLGNYWYLFLLILIPILGWMIIRFLKWKNERRTDFADQRFIKELFPKNTWFAKIFPVLYLSAFIFLIFAIVDLLSGQEEMESRQKMNNVIFMLDLSNSMNAEDVAPNRLSVAKNVMINTLEHLNNDRVGIVVFAGDSRSIMPLTTDYTAAETYIQSLETTTIQTQGTDFLKAIETSIKKLKNVPKNSRQIVLISDGEDNEGNDKAAMNLAQKEGVKIISVGVGTEDGAPIPDYIYGQLMGYKQNRNGETVISKRQTKALQALADGTGGTYINGNELNNATKQIVQSINSGNGSSTIMVQSQNAVRYYQYFLAVSVFLFFVIFLLNPKRDFNI